jgi:hypothetical protein
MASKDEPRIPVSTRKQIKELIAKMENVTGNV